MLRKADCRKMQKIPVTPKIKSLAAKKSSTMNYCDKPYEGLYRFYLRAIVEGNKVKISLFDAKWLNENNNTSKYDIFIDTEELKYITLEKDKNGNEVKWHTATLSYLVDYYYRNYEQIAWSNIDTDRKLRKALKITDNAIQYRVTGESYRIINKYQQSILDARLKKKEQAECEEWDRDMKPIKATPKNFNEWIRLHAIKEHYMFYNYSKKITKGFCSHCGKWVDISKEKPKNNHHSICPVCKTQVTYKSAGKIRTLRSKATTAQLVQSYPGGYVIRIFEVHMEYRDSKFEKPIIRSHEYSRYIYGKNKRYYDWGLYKNKYARWLREYSHGYWYSQGAIYPRNLNLLPLPDALRIAVKDDEEFSLTKWSEKVTEGSIYEKLLKAGFKKLFLQLFDYRYYEDDIYKDEPALYKALKIDKMRLKRLKAMDGGIRELIWLQVEKEDNTVYPDEMIRLFSDGRYEASNFRFIKDKMTYPQIFDYLRKQYKRYGYVWDYSLSCWRDYINMAAKLKIPLDLERNYKPKDIRIAHNEALDMLQGKDIENEAKQINRKWKKLKKIYPKLTKYEYSDKSYKIIAPKCTEDIVREGMILKHCVHSCDFYFERISTDESYILFLRKADSPTVPYYTLEVEPGGNIRQKRTTGDRQNKDFEDAKRFLEKWQRSIQKKITKEDKELGKKSNALRIKELAELRKNGNRVWHGVLQGQLLADVLEADFMPVITDGKVV